MTVLFLVLAAAARRARSYRFLKFDALRLRPIEEFRRRARIGAARLWVPDLRGEEARGYRERTCRNRRRAVEPGAIRATAKLRLAALRHLFD